MTAIYRIMTADDHAAFALSGLYEGSPLDRADGFIHMSTAVLVPGTLAAHFPGIEGLMLLSIDPAAVESALRWEESRGGALFPHLYRPLRASDILSERPIPVGPDGLHQLGALPD